MSFSNAELGSISATVELNLSPLRENAAEVKAILAQMTETLQSQVAAMEAQTAKSAAQAVEQANRAATQMAAQAEAHVRQSLNQIGNLLVGIGAATEAALGEATKVGADFEEKLTDVANNTTMTTGDIQQMSQAVKEMGRESGANMARLAEGFAHIENFSFSAADSTKILRDAMRGAVSTGTSESETAEILAKSLHEFGLGADFAGRAMNTLHLAAALGNMTLAEFDKAAGPAFAMASNLGVSLVDASAGMSALTRHGLDASEASTQLKDIIIHLVNPSKGAREEIERLSKATGINLVHDFSLAGLESKGLGGVLDDLKNATAGHREEVFKLIPALRGALGAYILTGTGVQDLKEITHQLTEAYRGEADPITEGYARKQELLTTQVARARNEMTLMADDIGKALMPALLPLIEDVREAAHWFQELSPEMKSTAVQGVALAGAAALVGGTILKLTTQFLELRAALAVSGVEFGALAAAGVEILPVVAVVAAVAAAVWGLDKALEAAIGDEGKNNEELLKSAQAEEARAKAAEQHSRQIADLVKQYGDLKAIVKPSAEQQEQMRQILDKISGLSPGLITGYDAQGHAIGLVGDAARKTAGDLAEMARQAQIASAATMATQVQQLAQRRDELDTERRHQVDLIKRGVGERLDVYMSSSMGGGASASRVEFPVSRDSGAMAVSNQKRSAAEEGMKAIDKQIADLNSKMRDTFHPATAGDMSKAGLGAVEGAGAGASAGGSGGTDKKGGGGSSSASDPKSAIDDVNDALFALSHSEIEVAKRNAWKEMNEQIAAGVPALKARLLYTERIAKIDADHAADVAKTMGGTMAQAVRDMKAQAEMELQNNAVPQDKLDGVVAAVQRKLDLERETEQSLQRQDKLQKEQADETNRAVQAKISEQLGAVTSAMSAGAGMMAAPQTTGFKDWQEQVERMTRYQYEQGVIDYKAYRAFLLKKLESFKEYSADWITANEDMNRASEENRRREKEKHDSTPHAKLVAQYQNALKSMSQSTQDILGGGLAKVLIGDSKNVFSEMLKAFETMLAQMVAQAAIAGIFNLATGGAGGFLGGVLGSFGFDDADNDRSAQRWGFDFMEHFGRGIENFNAYSAPSRSASSNASTTPVIVNVTGEHHYHNEMDVDRVADAIGWNVQQRLRGVYTG